MIKRVLSIFTTIFAVLVLLSACGPAAPSAAQVQEKSDLTSDLESADGAGGGSEDTAEISAVVDAAGTEANQFEAVDANDIPIGFTAEGRPFRGHLDAPVILEEFSDYQCPYCTRFTEQTLPSLLQNQIAAGEVRVIYYDFPLESIHPQAFAAANAARCAGEQSIGAYWDLHDILYSSTREWAVSSPDSVFVSLAEELELDMAQFEACVTASKYSEAIQADIEHALSRGVRSTPSFFLNDQPLVGAQPITVFDEAIALISDGQSIAAEAPSQEAAPQQSPLRPPPVKPEAVDLDLDSAAAVMGDPNAPVTIVEFTDYQCPYCQRYAAETLPRMISAQIDAGEVYYVLKDLPLDGIHPNARAAAVAARCAGEQDAYWPMHDVLFESQSRWSGQGGLPREVFIDLAMTLELDRAAFTACLDSEQAQQAIQENVDEARSVGADSTPYFFIEGLPISGAQPYELFEYAFELAKEGTLADAYVPPAIDLENVFAIGDPSAPVMIIEYTDYQCPYCSRHFEQTFGQIKENYIDSGQVYYVFKDFPLTNIHPQALIAAEAARCAGEQDAYAAMHDVLFAEQAAWNGRSDAADQFKQFAADLSLDSAVFDECLDSGRQQTAVMADLEEGSQQGINGTPAFIINGHSMSGAQPYAIFEQAIEQFLGEQG